MAVRSSSGTKTSVRRVSTTSTPGSFVSNCSSRSAMSSTSIGFARAAALRARVVAAVARDRSRSARCPGPAAATARSVPRDSPKAAPARPSARPSASVPAGFARQASRRPARRLVAASALRRGASVAPGAAESTCGAGFTSSSAGTSTCSRTGGAGIGIGSTSGPRTRTRARPCPASSRRSPCQALPARLTADGSDR